MTTSTPRTVTCPDTDYAIGADGTVTPGVHTIVGCGHTFTAAPDDEGLFDCPECGIWFNDDEAAQELAAAKAVEA